VLGLLSDVAQRKLEKGELTMAESGAALHAMLHRTNSSNGGGLGGSQAAANDRAAMRRAATLAAGSRAAPGVVAAAAAAAAALTAPAAAAACLSSARAESPPACSALAEAQAAWPDLWAKWVHKLEANGFLSGMPEISAERTANLERAAAKFLQSKSLAKKEGR
jgi:multidrug efflux pump subunit AcrA (membrane-fusion protein)